MKNNEIHQKKEDGEIMIRECGQGRGTGDMCYKCHSGCLPNL